MCMIQKEFDSTVLTNFLFTRVRENKGRSDGVRYADVFRHVIAMHWLSLPHVCSKSMQIHKFMSIYQVGRKP